MSSRLLNILSVGLIGSGLFLITFGLPTAFGQTETSTGPVPNTASSQAPELSDDLSQENQTCILEIADDVAVYDADIIQFLEQHYLNEAPASELLEVAFIKFQEYKDNMRRLTQDYRVAQAGQDYGQEFEEGKACQQFVEEHIRVIEAMFREHNLRNAGGKVSYTLVEKLKALNQGLKQLSHDFSSLYTEFKRFNDKLPATTP